MPPLFGGLRGQTAIHCQLPCVEVEKNAIYCKTVINTGGRIGGPKSIEYLADGGVVTQLLLDPTRYTLSKETQAEIENLGRNMLYALHCSRANKLRQLENN